MSTDSYQVNVDDAGQRLDFYITQITGHSRNQVQRWLQSGSVLVNGQSERSSYKLRPADQVTVQIAETPKLHLVPPTLPVVYEDEDILVVDKPAGLAVHPGAGVAKEATVADFARLHTLDIDKERPGIVHRLDRDTSGLLIIAKTLTAKTYLQAAFKHRDIHKTYLLLCVGRLKDSEAVIHLPLGRNASRPLQQAVVTGGREAITTYRVLEALPGYSYVEARPKTGRTHQLRAHFAALGHPIAGDTTYGPRSRPLDLTRHFLHAAQLEFTMPSGRLVKLESPLPAELKAALDQLRSRALS